MGPARTAVLHEASFVCLSDAAMKLARRCAYRKLSTVHVTHFWDGKRLAGLWFAQNVSNDIPGDWDIYFLYQGIV